MWISIIMQPNSQGPICSSLDMLVSIIERSTIRPHVPQPAADSGDCALSLPGDLGTLLVPWLLGKQGRKASFLLLGCPLINITFLINIKVFSVAHLEVLPSNRFSFWL